MYWPGMNNDINDAVSKCARCQMARNNQQREPLMPSEVPARPWQIVAADLLYCNNTNFLVVIDYFSEFIEMEELEIDTLSSTIIRKLAKIFAVHGIPEKLLTDNGPQLSSHLFKAFEVE